MPAFRAAGAALLTIAATLTLAAPASAHWPASINTTVPVGGDATITSPTLEPGQKSASVQVTPGPGGKISELDDLTTIFAATKSLKDRFLTCVFVYGYLTSNSEGIALGLDENFDENDVALAPLFLAACIELALQPTTAPGAGRATAAAAGCPPKPRQVPATFKKTGGRYVATINGTVAAAKRPALRVSCKRTSKGYAYKIRPRRKGATLKSVVGPRLSLGLVNPATAKRSAPAKISFLPR